MKFIRICRVEILIAKLDGTGFEQIPIVLQDLRISFEIQKKTTITTNQGNIRIWNVSQVNRNRINLYGDQVTVYAGYEGDESLQLLYRGYTTLTSHSFEFPEIVTTLECADSQRYVTQPTASVSFEAGTPVQTIIRNIINLMGTTISELSVSSDLIYPRTFSGTGLLSQSLLKICSYANLTPTFQNGVFIAVPVGGNITQQPFFVNANTGMIGIPQRFSCIYANFYKKGPAVGFKVLTFLNPQILAGASINLESRYLNMQGIFLVISVKHSGDTYGEQWVSQMEVTQLAV
jgi:hypothetical protein